jgi:hypothetical protein
VSPSNEARLLSSVARCGPIARADAAVRESLEASIDWDGVLDLAQRHGLAPLLHVHLDALPDAAVPKSVRARLWARAQAIARRNAVMAGELGAIVARLEAHGLGVVPYKGPTLAMRAYGDLALREFGDLDLLMRRGDVLHAKRILAADGYAPVHELAPAQEQLLIDSRRDYELALAHRARGVLVEIHWRGDPHARIPPLDDPAWWAALPRMTLADGTTCATLSTDELLLLLCVHGSKHLWSSLGWLVDVVELDRREAPADWGRIHASARRHGCERRLALAIALAAEVLDARLGDGARIPVDGPVRAMSRRIAADLFSPRQAKPHPLAAFRDALRMCDGSMQRAVLLADTAVAPGWGEWTRWRLPRSLFFLYPALRPVRLVAKYGLRIGAGETQLPPRLEYRHCDGIGEVEAAVPGPHRKT